MLILGIDPGSRVTGYGLVQLHAANLCHIDNGGIFTPEKASLSEKISLIFKSVMQLIDSFKPQALSIESVFYAKNVRSAIVLSHARAAAMIAACEKNIPVYEYTPLAVKQAVAGYGRASKEQIQSMVQKLLKLPEASYHDASDALALAICHLNQIHFQKKVSAYL